MWLDHITSSGLGLDGKSTTFQTQSKTRSLRPNLIRRWRACFPGLGLKQPNESVRAVIPPGMTATLHPLPGDNSGVAPPDPIPNSEVKRTCADGSVA